MMRPFVVSDIGSLWLRAISALLLCCLLLGCGAQKELETGLSSQESSQILSILFRAGLQAERVRISAGDASAYTVLIAHSDYEQAIEVLHEFGLPKERKEDLASFTKQKGFAPNSPEIVNLRLDHALGLQLERQLSSYPGVIEAKVVVRSHLRASGFAAQPSAEPGVSVMIRYLAGSHEESFSTEKIRNVVVDAKLIPGLQPDSVIVKVFPVHLPSLAPEEFGAIPGASESVGLKKFWPLGTYIPEKDWDTAFTHFGFYLIAFCICGIVVAVYINSRMLVRRHAQAMQKRKALSGTRPAYLEGGTEGRPGELEKRLSNDDSGAGG